jgi:cyclopropane fatty-acyl-phospholipid synthase-like methyltransferase
MTKPGRRLVEAGYDALAERYLTWAGRIEDDPRGRFVAELARRLPDGARVLDIGCGPGVPSTRALAERFDVVGVDVSEAQLRQARRNVPDARFVHADISDVRFDEASFDGVTALYSVSHIPRTQHEDLFRRIAAWLRPGGFFLVTLGTHDVPDSSEEWLGVPMFFSAHDADTNRALLRRAGFELVQDEIAEMREPEGPASFLWVLAQKAAEP